MRSQKIVKLLKPATQELSKKLFLAIEENQIDIINAIISDHPEVLHSVNEDNLTPLILLIKKAGETPADELLVNDLLILINNIFQKQQKHLNLLARDKSDNTILHYAAQYQFKKLIEEIVNIASKRKLLNNLLIIENSDGDLPINKDTSGHLAYVLAEEEKSQHNTPIKKQPIKIQVNDTKLTFKIKETKPLNQSVVFRKISVDDLEINLRNRMNMIIEKAWKNINIDKRFNDFLIFKYDKKRYIASAYDNCKKALEKLNLDSALKCFRIFLICCMQNKNGTNFYHRDFTKTGKEIVGLLNADFPENNNTLAKKRLLQLLFGDDNVENENLDYDALACRLVNDKTAFQDAKELIYIKKDTPENKKTLSIERYQTISKRT